MKIKGVIKNLKIKKIKKFKNDNSKIYLGISLDLLRAVWGQLFQIVFFLFQLILLLKVFRCLPM